MKTHITAEEIENGIYIDFEGTVTDPPVMLGLMYKKNGSDYFEQLIFDPVLKSASEAKAKDGSQEQHCLYLESLEEACEKIMTLSTSEKRKIFAWSIREQEVFKDSKLTEKRKQELEIVNALKISRQWAKRNYDISKIPVNARGQKYTLDNFVKIFDFHIPKAYGPGNSASRLRYVQSQLQKRGTYEKLTAVAKGKWTKFLKHNEYDLVMTKKVLQAVSNQRPNTSTTKRISTYYWHDSQYWYSLAKWAATTNNLQRWQRSLAYNIGKRISKNRDLTSKMASHQQSLLAEAKSLGFKLITN